MLMIRNSLIGLSLLLTIGPGGLPARGQEKVDQKTKPETGAKSKRLAYFVKHGSATDLAAVLSKYLKGDADVQALPTTSGNGLLINADAAVLDEVVKLLGQLDRAPNRIAVEILIARIPPTVDKDKPVTAKELNLKDFSGTALDILPRIEALQKKGEITSVISHKFTLLDGQPSLMRLGENKPSVSGVHTTGTGVVSRSITYRNTGIETKLTGRVTGDKKIDLDLAITESRLVPNESIQIGSNADGTPICASEVLTSQLNSKIQVGSGMAVAAEGMKTSSKTSKEQLLVVVTATILDGDGPGK